MTIQHKQLALGRWKELTFIEQMANIGSEVERTIRWKSKGNQDYSRQAFERVLELLDLSIDSTRNTPRLRELARLREVLSDYFVFSNSYHSTDLLWQKYFLPFTWAARAGR